MADTLTWWKSLAVLSIWDETVLRTNQVSQVCTYLFLLSPWNVPNTERKHYSKNPWELIVMKGPSVMLNEQGICIYYFTTQPCFNCSGVGAGERGGRGGKCPLTFLEGGHLKQDAFEIPFFWTVTVNSESPTDTRKNFAKAKLIFETNVKINSDEHHWRKWAFSAKL